MKQFAYTVTAFLLAAVLAGCGASEKMQQEAAEKALENALGGEVAVDIEGEKYTYEDKEGNKFEVGGTEWPSGDAADIIPAFSKGTIVTVVNMTGNCMIDLDNVEKKEFEAYVQTVKDAGFTQTPVEMTDETTTLYQAAASGGKSILLSYTAQEKHLQISASLMEE